VTDAPDATIQARLDEFAETYARIRREVRRVIVGHEEVLEVSSSATRRSWRVCCSAS